MLADKLPSREMILAELEYHATHRIKSFYPETGPLRRENYPKHMDFFEAGARHNERLFLGGNRVGKSVAKTWGITFDPDDYRDFETM
jgi:hypothetical protein